MDETRFRDYLPDSDRRRLRHQWVDVPYERYFAGTSKTWGGAVAFLSLAQDTEIHTRCKAYLIEERDLSAIVRQENGSTEDLSDELHSLQVDQWTALPTPPSSDGFRGKYNALLRLPGIEESAAYTLTTARRLQLGAPAPGYLALIEGALRAEGSPLSPVEGTEKDGYNARFVTSGWDIRFRWTEEQRSARPTGFDAVRLPLSYAPAVQFSAVLADLESETARAPTWITFAEDIGQRPLVDSSLADAVGLTPGSDGTHVNLDVRRPVPYRRLSGVAWDIPGSDVLQAAPGDAAELGRWVLVISPTIAAPFRVVGRSHVPTGSVRIGYAGRRLLGLRQNNGGRIRDDHVWVQTVSRPRWAARKRPIRAFGEALVGAPTVALRSTEGLVGDDGDRIVRVDSTALDLLGVTSGDRIVVSWGWRTIGATVLLQTESTLETMRKQLGEKTGHQARQSIGDVATRLDVPEHLRAWVSSQIRFRLQIPPDTVVRLRRSIPHTLLKHAFALALPAAGFVVAALALSRVPWYWAAALSVVVILATLASIRRRNGSGQSKRGRGSRTSA